MENEAKLTIWVVDEVERELKTTVSVLQRAIKRKADIEVIGLPAKGRKADYLDVVANPLTVALILDQKLQTRGIVDHTGIELALFLRNVVPNLPIYIMTNYIAENGEPNDEFNGADWSVDDILDKAILSNREDLRRFLERLLRRINIYQDITQDREIRFQSLLVKSMDHELSSEEYEEFNRISYERLGALALSDHLEQERLENLFTRLDERLAFLDDEASEEE